MILMYDTFVSSENLKQEKIVISKNSRKYQATPHSPGVAKTRPHSSRLFFWSFWILAEIRILCVAVYIAF